MWFLKKKINHWGSPPPSAPILERVTNILHDSLLLTLKERNTTLRLFFYVSMLMKETEFGNR